MRRLNLLGAAAATILVSACQPAEPAQNKGTVEFENSGVVYDIPVAFVGLHPDGGPTPVFLVTYPGLEPLRATGRLACDDWVIPPKPNGCQYFDVMISGGHGLSRRRMAENSRNVPGSKTQVIDKYGYTTWWLSSAGPRNLHLERSVGGSFYAFDCQMVPQRGPDVGFCLDLSPLSDGNVAHFFFPYRLRGDLPAIEQQIDVLVGRFRRR
jgi:hypothetical protein